MEKQKHSGLGIASFITSIASGFFIFMLIVIAGVIEVSTPGGMDEESASAVIIGLTLFVFLGVSLVALGLGIGGVCQKDRRKIFALLGIVFSVLTLVGTIFIVILGIAMG